MTETTIQESHKGALGRLQHVGEWLNAERARLEAEAAHIAQQMARLDSDARAFLMHHYGLDVHVGPFTLDVERGVIVTPDPEPTPAQPASEPLDE